MRMAEELAKRSTCSRLQVGSVITTPDLTQVLVSATTATPGACPTAATQTSPATAAAFTVSRNALIKAGAGLPGKVMFVSASPCVMCAKMIINTNVGRVYYREAYRDPAGLDVLRQAGVEVIHYDQWKTAGANPLPGSAFLAPKQSYGSLIPRFLRHKRATRAQRSISHPDSVCTIRGSTIGTSFSSPRSRRASPHQLLTPPTRAPTGSRKRA